MVIAVLVVLDVFSEPPAVCVGVREPVDGPGVALPAAPADGGEACLARGPALATPASERGAKTGALKTSPRRLTTLGKLAAEPRAMRRVGRRE